MISVQVSAVFVCITIGAAGGLLYEGISALRSFAVPAAVKAAADVLFFIVWAGLSCLLCTVFELPPYRLYMFAATMAGFLLERESLHRILAFFAEKIYNIYRRSFNRNRRKLLKTNERGKI